MKPSRYLLGGFRIVALFTLTAVALRAETIAAKTAGMQKFGGYFPMYWDAKSGTWLEVDKFEQEFLYVVSLAAGVGQTTSGLIAANLARHGWCALSGSGRRFCWSIATYRNYGFPAVTQNRDERRAVEEAFAQSVL